MRLSTPVVATIATIAAARAAFAQPAAPDRDVSTRLPQALAGQDAESIRQAVAAQNRQLAGRAGVPEVADTYLPIPRAGRWYSPSEAKPGFEPWFARIASAD